MTAVGVIPRPEDRRAAFRQTGEMFAGPERIVFGAEGETAVILCGGDIVLGPEDQDTFARHLFRALALAEDAGRMNAQLAKEPF